MSLLKTENLTKGFGGIRAVDNVNIEVEKGELSSIIGPNGAGKTTLFNLITKNLAMDSGKVLFNGENINRLSPQAICYKGIIRSFQRTNIFPGLTTFANIQSAVLMRHRKSLNMFSRAARMFKDEIYEILSAIELTDQAEIFASTLAYGDQRKLEIGIALAFQPQLLLLDEPTAGMSHPERLATAALIQRLARERGLTVVFTEHDMDVVFSASEKITVMHEGRIIISGRPEDIKNSQEVKQIYLGGEAR